MPAPVPPMMPMVCPGCAVKLIFSKDLTVDLNNTGDGADVVTAGKKTFGEGHALFMGEVMQCVTRMRDSETDFGMLPWPKYEESQENFYCFLHSTAGKGVCIPTTQLDPEKAGIIVEAMAAKSVSTVTEAYYDKAITYKYMRDEESAEMLDIILQNRIYDLAYSYDWGGLYGSIRSLIIKGNDTVSSTWQKRMSSAEKSLQRTIDAYKENE